MSTANKFAKKETPAKVTKGLVVDLDSKSPKMAVVGAKTSKISEKKILEKVGAKAGKATKAEKPAKAAKAEKVAKEPKEKAVRSTISDKKIKVLNKNHGAREGTKRAAWMDALVKSKTVAEAQGKVEGLDAGVVGFAVRSGFIELV